MQVSGGTLFAGYGFACCGCFVLCSVGLLVNSTETPYKFLNFEVKLHIMLAELTTINIADLEGNKLDASSSDGKKRQFNSEDGPEVMIVTPCSKENWMEEKTKRSKKFRVEWMNEVYFKDWLQPHPTDETYCICAACDIKLRCGKSELEKHASGLKHCKRMEAMKNDPHFKSRSSSSYSQSGDRILCEEVRICCIQ